jgi:hypothetical protein
MLRFRFRCVHMEIYVDVDEILLLFRVLAAMIV